MSFSLAVFPDLQGKQIPFAHALRKGMRSA
jgi:hypothetical protein